MAITTLAAGLRALVPLPLTVAPTKSAPTLVTTSHPSRERAPSRNSSPFDKTSAHPELSRLATISISGPSMALATHTISRSWQWRHSMAQEVPLLLYLKKTIPRLVESPEERFSFCGAADECEFLLRLAQVLYLHVTSSDEIELFSFLPLVMKSTISPLKILDGPYSRIHPCAPLKQAFCWYGPRKISKKHRSS
jgi:hypothetical protein